MQHGLRLCALWFCHRGTENTEDFTYYPAYPAALEVAGASPEAEARLGAPGLDSCPAAAAPPDRDD